MCVSYHLLHMHKGNGLTNYKSRSHPLFSALSSPSPWALAVGMISFFYVPKPGRARRDG